jgi:hypothetical protein
VKRKSYPRTRTHTAKLVSREPLKVQFSKDSPEHVQKWARRNLELAKITSRRVYLDLLEYKAGDPVIQDIAWCLLHAAAASGTVAQIPEAYRSKVIRACAHMFQAGKRHESLDEYQKHAPAIEERNTRELQRAKARDKSANSRRKITEERFDALSNQGLTIEQIAEELDVTPQAVTKFRRRRKTGSA